MAVDDLFDGQVAPGRSDAAKRLRRWLLVAGVLVVLGPCCCTGPLGGLAAVFVWMRAGDEQARAKEGVGGPGLAQAADRARSAAFTLMTLSTLSLCAQALVWPWLEPILLQAIAQVLSLLGGSPDLSTP